VPPYAAAIVEVADTSPATDCRGPVPVPKFVVPLTERLEAETLPDIEASEIEPPVIVGLVMAIFES